MGQVASRMTNIVDAQVLVLESRAGGVLLEACYLELIISAGTVGVRLEQRVYVILLRKTQIATSCDLCFPRSHADSNLCSVSGLLHDAVGWDILGQKNRGQLVGICVFSHFRRDPWLTVQNHLHHPRP